MSWLHYIDDFTRPLQNTFWSKKYFFKSWKVYRDYRWYVSEQMDFNGVLDGTDMTFKTKMSVGYRYRYIK